MTLQRPTLSFLALLALLLSGCSPQEAPAKREATVEVVAAQAKGFAVGSMMSRNTAYVFFDAQCPHCGHLWEAALPLHKKLKFVWIPVAIINPSSAAQGAALLAAANPQALMSEHEASLLAGRGGISGSSSVASEIEQAIKGNTQLFNSFSAESVPFIVARNARTGQGVTHLGSMGSAALADFLGVDAAP